MDTIDPRPPNVLLIIMDDLAWGDLACHGNPYTRTPHLDQLHDESVRLTRYCSGPVCTPARAALMTGRHPYRTRAIDTYLGRSCMDPDEVTLAELFRDAGYRTCISGKWHLGDCYPMRAMDKGFEEALVHNGGGLMQPGNFGRDDYFDPELLHNGGITPTDGYCTDVFGDHAAAFIEAHRDEPWFCYYATNAPHSPFQVPDAWAEPYRQMGLPETWARVYGMVENIDANVGKLRNTIDRLGLTDDTLVIYTSDHGPCGSAAVDGQDRWNGDLRGRKMQMYEGGVKVPCFWSLPDRIAGGRDVDRLANPIDVLPTLATLCGLKVPTGRIIDGVDLLPTLTGDDAPDDWPGRTVCLQWQRGDQPVRYRNAAAIEQQYKWLRPHESQPDELYDLIDDPAEQRNLASEQSEIVERLRGVYDRWFDDVSSTRPDNYAPPRIVIGTPHENPTVLTRQDWRLYPGVEEAWDTEHPGYWPIRIAEAGRYRVRIAVPNPGQSAMVRFRCGGVERSETITRGWGTPTKVVWFDELPLPAGEHDLEAWFNLDGGRQRLGAWNIEIRRCV
jgi:arylsulfatase/arylsulfatase A